MPENTPSAHALVPEWSEPVEASDLAALARRYAAEEMFDEAVHLLEMACKLRPGDANYEADLARIRDQKKAFEEQIRARVRAGILAERNRDDLDAAQYAGLAQFHIETGQTSKAIELLEIAKLRSPNALPPYAILGRLYFATGEWEAARTELAQARKLNPFDRELAELAGRVAFELKDYSTALADLVDAFILTPERRSSHSDAVRRMINTIRRIQSLDSESLHALVRDQLNQLALFAERLEFRKENLFRLGSRAVVRDILKKVTRETEKRENLIAISAELRRLAIFRELSDEQVFRLARFARLERVDEGSYLFREGDQSMSFYVIQSGELEIRKETPVGPHFFARLGRDEILGEMNFLDRTYRSADALARTPTTCFGFAFTALDQLAVDDRETAVALHWAFWKSLSTKVRAANEQLRRFFPEGGPIPRDHPASERVAVEVASADKVDLFQERGLSATEMKLLATFTREERFYRQGAIFREGDPGDKLYIVLDGRVRISKFIPGAGEEALAILGRGEFFGEMALVDEEPRSADAWAHEGTTTVLAVDRATLREVLSMDPSASLQFLNLLCRLISRRLREIDDKLVQWRVMAGGF